MADTLREKIAALDVAIPGERHAYVTVKKVLAIIDEHCGDEERLKHLLRRAIGLLRGATFEDAENKITASVVIEEGLKSVGGNTKLEGK